MSLPFRVSASRVLLWACAGLAACRFVEPPPTEADLPGLLSAVCSTRVFEDLSRCECLGPVKLDSACEALAQTWVAGARELGLTYDASCVLDTLDAWLSFPLAANDCESDRAGYRNWIPCEDECQIFHGDAEQGEPCDIVGRRMSTCSASLFCGADGTCHAPCDVPLTIEAGAPCGPRLGYVAESCAAPLVCDPELDVCVMPLALGEDCSPSASTCAVDAFCPPDASVCTLRFPIDTPCTEHEQCASRVCDDTCLREDAYACANHYL
jgi:hypothetical protein